MKSYIVYAFVCICTLTSCVASKFPIDEKPVRGVDERFLGTWKQNDKAERNNSFIVTASSPYWYSIQRTRGAGTETEYYRAFISDVDGIEFINLTSPVTKDSGYMFLKILDFSANGNKLRFAVVMDTAMPNLANAAAVRNRLYRNINNPQLYSDTATFIRVK